MVEGTGQDVSPESLLCGQALKSTLLATSRDCGWTTVLVDHHRLTPHDDVFGTVETPDQTIVAMLSGEQEIEAFSTGAWRRATYRTGTVGMTPGGHTDRLRHRVLRGPGTSEKANLYIPQRVIQDVAEHYRRAGQGGAERPLSSLAFQDPTVTQTAAALVRAMRAGMPDLYAQAAVCWLVTHLLSAHARWLDVGNGQERPAVLSDARLSRVQAMLRERYAEPLRLEDLALEAGVSKFHFARAFKARTGTSPHACLVEIRIEAACRLLADTDLSVKQVAARCGFLRTAHFGTTFTRRLGVPPSAYRMLTRRQGS